MQRIKKVFTDISKVAHLWANQEQDEARNSGNFYFSGDTIYSYGSHFPIAKIVDNASKDKDLLSEGSKMCFFTLDTYSSTTASHISVVRQASSHLNKLYMVKIITNTAIRGVYEYEHKTNIDYWLKMIAINFDKLSRARNKEQYHNAIAVNVGQLKRYIAYFGIRVDKATKQLIDNCNPDNFAAYSEAESKRIIASNKAKAKKETQALIEALTKWRNGESQRLYSSNNSGYDYLRYNIDKQRVETTQAFEIPVKLAVSFYHAIIKTIANGGCKDSSCMEQTKLLNYDVKEITDKHIIVGCHKISIEEINNCMQVVNQHYIPAYTN